MTARQPEELTRDLRPAFGLAPRDEVVVVRWGDDPEIATAGMMQIVSLGAGSGRTTGSLGAILTGVRRLLLGGASRGLWRAMRRRADLLALARGCAVVVALDPGAVRSVWHLARHHPHVPAVYGAAAAARALGHDGS